MKVPLNSFYLLRILYLEAVDKNRSEWDTIGDFAFVALLSNFISHLDEVSGALRACLVSYRSRFGIAKILPPRVIANREFVLEEYLAICATDTPVLLETDMEHARIRADAGQFAALHRELEALLLPHLRLSHKRSIG